MSDTNEAERDAHEWLQEGKSDWRDVIGTDSRSPKLDPDTTLDDPPFVTDPNDFSYDDPAAPWNQKAALEVADVFAVVAAYDHAVGSPTAPEYDTYDEARDAGIVLLTVNENVVSFRIDKRTTRKA